MFGKKREPVEVVVGESGLAQLVRDLHWSGELGMVSGIHGPTLTIFAQSRGTFLVRLPPWQADILVDRLPRIALHSVYGPKEGEELSEDS